MLAFVDESGDPGRKIANGSSQFFVVSLVTFEDHDEADDCDRRIEALRGELRVPPGFEFHFSENSNRIWDTFLAAVSPYSFFYHSFALNKDPNVLSGPGFNFKGSLYKFTARLTFENAKPYLDNAIVVLDSSGDRTVRNELATYLRRRVTDEDGRKLIKKVKTQRSDGNNLLQLADYVASVSNRAFSGKPDGLSRRRTHLAPHEISWRIWP